MTRPEAHTEEAPGPRFPPTHVPPTPSREPHCPLVMIKLVTVDTQNALGQVLLVYGSELSLCWSFIIWGHIGLSVPKLKVSQVTKTKMEQCQR